MIPEKPCRYCGTATKNRVVWLKDKQEQPARIRVPWCGCDLRQGLKLFWPNPYQVVEGVDYEVETVAGG